MWKDKSIRKGVLASVIASVIVIIFINPLLDLIWKMISDGGNWIYKSYVDSIYQNASLGNRNWLDVIFYLHLLSIFVGGLTIATFGIIRKRKELSKKMKEVEDKINGKNDKDEEITKEQLIERFQKLKTSFSKTKNGFITLYIGLASLLIISVLSYFRVYSDLQLNSTFNQRIKIVAPHIGEQKEEELIALWTSMKTRNDYETIINEFETIAKKSKIKLPEPLMK